MMLLAIAAALTLMEGEFYYDCKGGHCKESCVQPDIMRLVSAHEGKTGETIQIQECGNEFRVRFYVIDFAGFKSHEIITLLPVEDVSLFQSVVTCDHHGKAKLIMFTEQPKRKMKVLDFTFRWRNVNHTMCVNKLIAEPIQEPEVIETPKAKPAVKATPMHRKV
jgi:hypothetical protein